MATAPSLGDIALQTVGEAIAFAAGFAAGRAMEPVGVALAQAAWDVAPIRAVDATTAAAIVAEDVEKEAWGAQQARLHGYTPESFDAILGEVLNAPGVPELLTLYRRNEIGREELVHGLRKAKLETRWDAAIEALADARLEPAVVALAIVRGLVVDPGILPVGPPAGDGKVPRFPVFNVDAIAEAEAAGIDRERLSVMVGNMGRPASPLEAAHAEWRGVIEHVDYLRAISEGDVRNEWAEAIFESARAILSPHEYQEGALRGIITAAEADDGAAKHGMSAADAHLLFETLGRPVSVRAITTGLARGGTLGGTYADVPEPYQDAIRRSNIRPEYAGLAYANRYSYPGAFVLRSLAQAGELTEAETLDVLLKIGWEPALAEKVAKRWAGGGGGAGKQETKAELDDEYQGGFITETEYRAALEALGFTGAAQELEVELGDARRAKRYREKVIDAINAAYLAFRLDDTAAGAELAAVNVTGSAATMLLALWQLQRRDTIRLLTPAQVKKAFTRGIIDRATALSELEDREYTAADAATLLDE